MSCYPNKETCVSMPMYTCTCSYMSVNCSRAGGVIRSVADSNWRKRNVRERRRRRRRVRRKRGSRGGKHSCVCVLKEELNTLEV